MQAADVAVPATALYVPAAQPVHAADVPTPAASLYVPAAHGTHTGPAEYVPATHDVHTSGDAAPVEPTATYSPAPHEVQADPPESVL